MDDNSSDSSVVEIVIKKKFPPLIHLDEEDIILNVNASSEPFIDTIVTGDVAHECFNSDKANNPNHWTEDMIRFYNDDWGDEEFFIVRNIQEKMNKNPDLWKVSNKDTISCHSKKRQSKLRCWNCCQHGHTISNCPDPLHEVKCHMCGRSGHEGKSCPNAKCLNCGAASRAFVNMCNKCVKESKKKCSRCNVEGHYFINCTDHWRKYHYTTKTKEIKRPEYNVNKPLDQMWCCNCGRRGHHQAKCGMKRSSPAYPNASPFVASYDDLFTSTSENTENAAKRKRYFEEDSADRGKGLSWPEKIEHVIGGRDKLSDEVTLLFERKEKPSAYNPFRNWEEWFVRERRKNKNKNYKGKRQKLVGNFVEMLNKKNRKEHQGSSGQEIRKTKNRKEIFISGKDKKAIRRGNNR